MNAIASFAYEFEGQACRDTLFRLNDGYLMHYSPIDGDPERWERLTEAQVLQRMAESLLDLTAPGPMPAVASPGGYGQTQR